MATLARPRLHPRNYFSPNLFQLPLEPASYHECVSYLRGRGDRALDDLRADPTALAILGPGEQRVRKIVVSPARKIGSSPYPLIHGPAAGRRFETPEWEFPK